MVIAKANQTGTIAHYFREASTSVDLTSSKYRTIDDLIAGVDSGKRPVFKTNDELGTEASASTQKLHYKLYFNGIVEGSPIPEFFAKKPGYFLPDFSQNAYTLASYFSPDVTTPLVIGGRFDYDKKSVKLKMVGNILGSVNSTSLPAIIGGFTSCIITRSGVPYFYVSNGTENYYIGTELESTTDTSPWRSVISNICCSLIHCNNELTTEEFNTVKTAFLGITAANLLGSVNLTESNESKDLTVAKIIKVNTYLSEDSSSVGDPYTSILGSAELGTMILGR